MNKLLTLFLLSVALVAQTKDSNPRQLAVVTFANLGTPANGTIVFCSDCTQTSPVAGSGTGVVARRENGAWNGAGSSGGTCATLGGDTTGTCAANTTSKINNTSFAGTSGHLVSFGASNIPADSGVVASTVTKTIASGAKTLNTTSISSASCSSAQTDTATGTLTTDAIIAAFNGDPTAITGYVPLTTGMLTIIPYPTADTVNFRICNNTSASITPGAVTINWRVVR